MPSADFLRLNPGFNAADMPGANRRRGKRSAPGLDRPARAKPGDGDRVPDLMRLAAGGWVQTNYCHASGEFWMTHSDGQGSPRVASYRAMLETTLELL